MPRDSRTSRSGAAQSSMGNSTAEEQRRIMEQIEQERADHEFAMRLQQENYQAPTPQLNRQNGRVGGIRERGSARRTARGARAAGSASNPPNGSRLRDNTSASNTPSTSGGPIRRARTAAATSNRGRQSGNQNRRERTSRRNTGAPLFAFEGDRVIARQGNQSADVTSSTYFPSDDDDDDYTPRRASGGTARGRTSQGAVRRGPASAQSAAVPRSAVRPRETPVSARGLAARRGQSAARSRPSVRNSAPYSSLAIPIPRSVIRAIHTAGSARGGTSQRGRGGRRPAVNGDYIQMLLHGMMEPIDDGSPDYEESGDDDDIEENLASDISDESDGSEMEELAFADLQEIVLGSDSEDEDEDEFGPVHADINHINQPIFEEDREMYNHELDLYHNDDEYDVPPPKEQLSNGKPVAPDATWGDCTMCSNTPVKPQGCKKCLQFLGCTDCVNRWHAARRNTYEGSSCPLCRAEWNIRPSVLLMKNIEKLREKENKSTSSNAGSSSSSSTS